MTPDPTASPTDARADLAALIADALATLELLVASGVDVLPTGPVAGLGAAPELSPARPPAPAARARPPEPLRPPEAPVRSPAPSRPQPDSFAPPPEPQGSGVGLFGSKWARAAEGPEVGIAALSAEILACRACGRCEGRRAALTVDGPPRPLVLVVLDPPDAEADRAGTLLMGEAATMLEKMLLNVVRVDRREVQVSPVVRCAGGVVTPAEAAACRPFLDRQVQLARPRVVLVMGEVARALLALPRPGEWGTIAGVPALATAHPAHLLKNPAEKKLTFQHLQELARKVG